METISIELKNIKNITHAFIEFPLQKGISVIVGGNGSGKSTILQALSQSFARSSLRTLDKDDYIDSSEVVLTLNEEVITWKPSPDSGRWENNQRPFPINGMYEGSLFYGSRFNDSRLVDPLLRNGAISAYDIVDADEYIKEKLSFILHGTHGMYSNLKRLRNREIAKKHGLVSTPYFNEVNGKLISQYRMSSGECLLITLLHFVYNAIIRRSLPKDQFILALIDEIEVALHPIAVHRFLETIRDLVDKGENVMVVLTSHSPEVIRKIDPKNIYKIENENGAISVINPAYPSYVIRDIYKHDGFDTLILTEDILAKMLTQKIIDQNGLSSSKLLHIVPVGGWENVLRLHHDLLSANVLGVDRKIFSIIDGDVSNSVPDTYKNLKKLFLPLDSIEKFLLEVCVHSVRPSIKRLIGDKYFTIKSIGELVAEHTSLYRKGVPSESKKFYNRLLKDLAGRGISEDVFIEKLSSDLLTAIDFGIFTDSLKRALS